jgi:hypothetical protein
LRTKLVAVLCGTGATLADVREAAHALYGIPVKDVVLDRLGTRCTV